MKEQFQSLPGAGNNQSISYPSGPSYDPKIAPAKKVQYERAERFRELVEGAIKANAPER